MRSDPATSPSTSPSTSPLPTLPHPNLFRRERVPWAWQPPAKTIKELEEPLRDDSGMYHVGPLIWSPEKK